MKPLLSLVTTVYNQERYIKDLVESVVAQNWPIEWTVVDDGSRDGSFVQLYTLTDKISPMVKTTIVHNKVNQGPYRAFMQGFSLPLNGKYCAILEGDDCWKPGFLEKTIGHLEANPNTAIVHTDTDYHFIDEGRVEENHWRTNGRYSDSGVHYRSIPSGRVLEHLIINNFIMTCASVGKTEVFKKCYDWKTFRARRYLMSDYPFALKVARLHPIDYIDESLAVYRVHGGGTSAKRAAMVECTMRIKTDARLGRL